MPGTLERFTEAQADTWETALAELRAGSKQSHWMWFVLPQLARLGRSETARFFGLAGLDEARAYLAHPVLGPRLVEAVTALLAWAGRREAAAIMGPVDALKLRSCLTLFEAAGGDPVFAEALEAFYAGQRDGLTLDLLHRS